MPEDDVAVIPAVVEITQDSNPVKQLREHADALKAEGKAKDALIAEMQSRLRDADLATLSETERLKKQLEDATPFKERADKYEASMKELYDKEIASLPESHREKALDLSSTGDWADRLNYLQKVKTILAPQSAGSVTQPVNVVKSSQASETPNIPFGNSASEFYANYSKVKSGNLSEAARNIV
jgi:hypothetical protein